MPIFQGKLRFASVSDSRQQLGKPLVFTRGFSFRVIFRAAYCQEDPDEDCGLYRKKAAAPFRRQWCALRWFGLAVLRQGIFLSAQEEKNDRWTYTY